MTTTFTTDIINKYKDEVRRLLEDELQTKVLNFSYGEEKPNTPIEFRRVELTANGKLKVEFYRRKVSGFQILNPEQHISTQDEEVAMWAGLYNAIIDYANTWWDVDFDSVRYISSIDKTFEHHFHFRFYIGTKNKYNTLSGYHVDGSGTSWMASFDLGESRSSYNVKGTPFRYGVNVIDTWHHRYIDMDTFKITKHELSVKNAEQ